MRTRSPDRFGVARRERRRLLSSSLGCIEAFECCGLGRARTDEDYSPHFQVCLPYSGLFVWHVGRDDVVADSNQVLFVAAGETFRLSAPRSADFAELIVTPSIECLTEITGTSECRLRTHPLFARRTRRASLAVQFVCGRALRAFGGAGHDGLEGDEWLVDLLRLAFDVTSAPPVPSERTCRLLKETKEFLAAHMAAPVRLADVARAVHASPAYLTDVFRRHEGVALHRYLMQLRLARALIELPHADCLTTLALDLGFSSHSHFAAAFRQAFHCTPSAFRTSTRADSRQLASRGDTLSWRSVSPWTKISRPNSNACAKRTNG
ncbi:MAG TPA: AraC family transcriptional regulator [Vicinamibacterales bacterium]